MLYEYKCACGLKHEKITDDKEKEADLCECGQMARRVISISPVKWGWILTEASHHKGNKDEWVKDKPSNDPIVFKEKEMPSKIFAD